jgi:exodeoxyribonuclease V beta subunit
VNWLNGLEVSDSLLKGALTGSIDAVLVTGDAMAPKCVVVDYKTNRLGDEGAINYDQPTMLAAMDEHHYQLQAVVYLVALHRYLRSRLADYSYERHVGGAAYLFVRGLDADMPGHGIVWLQPSAECISELSDLFEGGLRV